MQVDDISIERGEESKRDGAVSGGGEFVERGGGEVVEWRGRGRAKQKI